MKILAMAACLSTMAAAGATEHLLRFDTGDTDSSMVVGLFLDDGRMYHPAAHFEFGRVDALESVSVLVGLHVGREASPAPGQTELKAGVRVNGGDWQWQPLEGLRDDGLHWVAFPVPVDHWRAGTNRVEVTSTAGSRGNYNARTVDIPCSFNPSAKARAFYSHDLQGWSPLRDRHWAIRVRYARQGDAAPARALHVVGGPSRIRHTGQARFTAVVEDGDGLFRTPEDAQWSASGGAVSDSGTFVPDGPGEAAVTARAEGLEGHAEVRVADASWTGVVPPDSEERLGPRVPEGHVDLCGTWDFALDPDDRGLTEEWFRGGAGASWGSIYVPGCWQGQAAPLSYHGVGWYRRAIEVPEAWRDRDLWLRFGGAATDAQVWVNGQPVGGHLGNWTPFRLRITDAVQAAGTNEVVVRVRELPDHFSAGFARVLGAAVGTDNHFGGLWQEVSLAATGPVRIEDVYAAPSLADSRVRVDVKAGGGTGTAVCSIVDPDGAVVARQECALDPDPDAEVSARFAFAVDGARPWSPESPALYEARVEVQTGAGVSDARTVRFGMRDAVRSGRQILLNGKPIFIRGILHWGYYPHLFGIDPSEAEIRREFRELRQAGFNLVKVCLFVFPKRFYEIADEEGMLIWQEYPLWQTVPHRGDTGRHDIIRREYVEWLRFDRNHPSVIVRDLTCEADPGVVDMDFLGDIYDMAKAMTDGALLEDNSGFFTHVKTDFYDAHFYRDLDEMYLLLPALAAHMRSLPETKPYLSGEDMDADTYRDMAAIRAAWSKDGALPWWIDNGHFRNQEGFEEYLVEKAGPEAPAALVEAQNRHVLAFRKLLFEEIRTHPELTGYAMTCIRDNPLTRPGFYDDLARPKWSGEAWHRFSGDYVLTLSGPVRSRCFAADGTADLDLLLSNYGQSLAGTPVTWRLLLDGRVVREGRFDATGDPGEVLSLGTIRLDWRDLAPQDRPAAFRLEAQLGDAPLGTRNDWALWTFPSPTPQAVAYAYSPDGSDRLVERLPGLGLVAVAPGADGRGWTRTDGGAVDVAEAGAVLLADALDGPVRQALEAGGRVVYVTRDRPQPLHYAFMAIEAEPDDGPCSGANDLPRVDAPFWREMTVSLPRDGDAFGDFPHQGFVDLQFLGLTQRRPFQLGDLRESVRPVVWGVNARFNDPFPVVDYLFEAQAGRGRILATCLNVFGRDNTAGRYLLGRLLEYQAARPASTGDDGTDAWALLGRE